MREFLLFAAVASVLFIVMDLVIVIRQTWDAFGNNAGCF